MKNKIHAKSSVKCIPKLSFYNLRDLSYFLELELEWSKKPAKSGIWYLFWMEPLGVHLKENKTIAGGKCEKVFFLQWWCPAGVAVSWDPMYRFRPFEQRCFLLPWSSISGEYYNHKKLKVTKEVTYFSSFPLIEKAHCFVLKALVSPNPGKTIFFGTLNGYTV